MGHGPCGGDGLGVKNATALRIFPIDDFRNGLLASYSRSIAFGERHPISEAGRLVEVTIAVLVDQAQNTVTPGS